MFGTRLFRVVVDDHKVRRCLVEVAGVDCPGRVVPPVPSVAVVELHAVHVQVVDAALDVDAQPRMGGEGQIRCYQVWETFDSKTVETLTITSLQQSSKTPTKRSSSSNSNNNSNNKNMVKMEKEKIKMQ